jgi:hypothetical protein
VLLLSAASQLNVEAAPVVVSEKLKGVPLQTDPVLALFITGFGLTVTVMVCAAPVHPSVEVGVTV